MIRWSKRLVIALATLFSAGQVAADEANWAATYRVDYGTALIGELHREVSLDQGRYRFESRLTPKGMGHLFSGDHIEQISSGSVDAQGQWQPEHYSYSNSGKPDKPRDFVFDWTAQQLVFAGESLPITVGVHDELSQMTALARQVAGGQQQIELSVFNGRKRRIYEYHYQVGEQEMVTVSLPSGDAQEQALIVTLTTSRGKYSTRFWLASQRNYLPLRIERTQIKKQQTVVMQLVDLK